MTTKIRMAMVGCGGMAQHHLSAMLQQLDTTEIAALCDPTAAALERSTKKFTEAGITPPPTWSSLDKMLTDIGGEMDATFIITPHALHHDQAVACMETGLDVLLEKPMAINAAEATSLIETRDRTGQLLAVAFQGSLSPEVRKAVEMLRSGQLGEVLNISGIVWQNWRTLTTGAWRQTPHLSGGGFMFDSGAHLLNTVSDLAGEEFEQVAAWFDNRNTEVDILAAAMGRLKSGVLVTLNGCGDTIPSCESDVRVFCTKGILQTGVWGGYLRLQRHGSSQLRRVKCPPSLGSWQQFVAIRSGQMENTSPPEVGLRMARLWDALQASAAKGGQPVMCDEV